jgi:hypothetical protein
MPARRADLPIKQPTKFDLVVDLQTAWAQGSTVPPSILPSHRRRDWASASGRRRGGQGRARREGSG